MIPWQQARRELAAQLLGLPVDQITRRDLLWANLRLGRPPTCMGSTPDDEDQRARYAAYALGRRAAEAATVRIRANQLLDGHGQDRAVIVLGDLNDTEYSATTTTLQGPWRFGDQHRRLRPPGSG